MSSGRMDDWIERATLVEFPLRGEWRALNTPAERVPSHGTDYFAQRYAIDFVRMDETGAYYHRGGGREVIRYLTVGLPASDFLCWAQPIHSAFAGQVVATGDGWPDREHVHFFLELLRVSVFPPSVSGTGDLRPLAGNYVIVEGDAGFAFYAHVRRGTVSVRRGQSVRAGDIIGEVGNSGNSTMPHLHFHLMDGPDPLRARALPFAFCRYSRWSGTGWEPVGRGVPGALERIRSGDPSPGGSGESTGVGAH